MLIWSVLGILGCVVLDQLTKYFAQLYLQPVGTMPFIPGIMELRFVLNDGAAFSSFAGARLFLILFTGIAIAALAVYLFWKKPPKRLERTALVLLIGGGLGNSVWHCCKLSGQHVYELVPGGHCRRRAWQFD